MIFSNGDEMTGVWKNGVRQGRFSTTYSNNNIATIGNKISGKFIEKTYLLTVFVIFIIKKIANSLNLIEFNQPLGSRGYILEGIWKV